GRGAEGHPLVQRPGTGDRDGGAFAGETGGLDPELPGVELERVGGGVDAQVDPHRAGIAGLGGVDDETHRFGGGLDVTRETSGIGGREGYRDDAAGKAEKNRAKRAHRCSWIGVEDTRGMNRGSIEPRAGPDLGPFLGGAEPRPRAFARLASLRRPVSGSLLETRSGSFLRPARWSRSR